jgi:phage FluMu protein Com
MTEVRCPAVLTTREGFVHTCNRKLAEDLSDGILVIRCSRCKTVVSIDRVDRVEKAVI